MPVTQPSEAPFVFILPGLADDDLSFEKDWGLLRESFPIVKISYLDWTDLIKPGSDVNTMVSHVKRQIEGHAQAGPLRIVGYSIGGFLAYHCALAFQSEGRTIERLAILDTSPPNQIAAGVLPLSKRLRERFFKLASFEVRKGLGSILAKVATNQSFLPRLRRLSRFRHVPLPLKMEAYLHHKITWQLEIDHIRSWGEATHPPEVLLMAPTTVFLSADYDAHAGIELAWREHCPNSNVVRVEGDHDTMLQPPNNRNLFSLISDVMSDGRCGLHVAMADD